MADYTKKPNTIPWPPIITVGAIIIGWLAQRIEHLDWISGISEFIWPLGILMVVAGIAIVGWAFLTFQAKDTTILPNKAASNLATTGPYRWSRNPIYVSDILFISGIAVITGNAWMLMAAIFAVFAIEEFAIKREERHLKAKFAQEWADYSSRVRRWI